MATFDISQRIRFRNELINLLSKKQQQQNSISSLIPSVSHASISLPAFHGSMVGMIQPSSVPRLIGYGLPSSFGVNNHSIASILSLQAEHTLDEAARRLIKIPGYHSSCVREENPGELGESQKSNNSTVQSVTQTAFTSCLKRPRSPQRSVSSAVVLEEESTAVRKDNDNKKANKWLSTLEELKEYKAQNGDCIVPRGYTENHRLASWVAEQRKQYKLMENGKPSSITQERIRCLEELGFAWNAQEAAWSRHIQDLTNFRQENGHCHVPLNHGKYPRLGLWVKEQRRHYSLLIQGKKSHMNETRKNSLDAVGFCWDTHEAIWMERFRELTEFKEKYGTCGVPIGYSGNPKLATWVHHQRRQYKRFMSGKTNCHITEERIQDLENLGFVWHPRERSNSLASFGGLEESDNVLSQLHRPPNKRHRAH